MFNTVIDQQGLRDLSDFKKRHPGLDLAPFLMRASPFFQQYVSRNLELIELRDRHKALGEFINDFELYALHC